MENKEPAMSLEQAKATVETKVAPRITSEWIESQIASVQMIRHGTMTICVIEMRNGFKSVGKSAPASAANYDKAVGERYAYEDAFKPLWQLEAYRLLTDLRRQDEATKDALRKLPEARSPEL
jgi:hypothetical protein